METFTLANGIPMPRVGMGTYRIDQNILPDTIKAAYELGYRKFDTAWRYKNERLLTDTLFSTLGIKREDIFITTKVISHALFLWGWHGNSDWMHKAFNYLTRVRSIEKAVEMSFKNLNVEYVDLFLVHAVCPWYREMYEVLTKFYHQGRIRAIGVSSFLPPHIESLRDVSDVVPMVNQFEISPRNTQKQLIEYCKSNGIVPEAMSTLSHYQSNEVRTEILENDKIVGIARKFGGGKTPAQIVWRWLYQQGVSIIPKTWNLIHLKENISIFDFELSPEDMELIDSLDEGKFLNYDCYTKLQYLPKKYQDWTGFPIK